MSNVSRKALACAILSVGVYGCAANRVATTRPAEPFPSATPERVTEVTKNVFPAVVRLDVAQEVYDQGKRTLRRGIGSGVIIDDQGRILTNFHVAGRAAEIYVTLFNKERVPAKLVGDDHWTDLAVVQMDMNEIKKRNATFTAVQWGSSSSLKVGQDVIAIGTPFGLSRTMTLGIVSNSERTFYPETESIDEYETGEFANWIQMDTPIAPGNSGGPLVDLDGKLVGINTRGIQGQALNFAIPIDVAKRVAAELIRTGTDKEKGHVDRADLGLDFKPMQDLETYYAIDINRGVLINSVDRGSPAAKVGLKPQDILLSIDGRPTNVRFPEELAKLRQMIADLGIGKQVKIEALRGGKPVSFTPTTVKLESAVGEEREAKAWGISVRDVTRAYANEEQLDDDQGVVITSLTKGYPADKAELQPGDVIRAVNGKPVVDLDAFMKFFDESNEKKQTKVLLQVARDRGIRDALLKLSYSK
ncbi:MAG: trypsin-like peptidase domain-containing protein [Tepidisphaeraceae bacterium]